MIKYAGIIIFCISMSALGAYLSSQIKCSTAVRGELIEFIYYIYNGIKYGGTSLEQLYSQYSSVLLDKYGLISSLRENKDIYLTAENSLYMLGENEREKIIEFFSKLGKSHLCEQELILCSSCIEYLKEIQQKAQKEDASKALLYKKLGIIVSLICAIIFI